MRQGQQNRRGRGRGGRKAPNPLVRNYESSGPDVKIRGTAAQVAEKYTALARDAMATGDIIAAESYLQHAEHYNRIIMAAQAQMAANGSYANDGYNGVPGAQNHQYQPDDMNGYREPPFGAYADEFRPAPQPVPAPRPVAAPCPPDSPQPVIPAAPAPSRDREMENSRRRRKRHQPNGADHPLAEAGEGGGRVVNGVSRAGGLSSDDGRA